MTGNELRKKILNVLKRQGFKINPHARPKNDEKATYRDLQKRSRNEQIKLHKAFLQSTKQKIESYSLNGKDLKPENIELELREVKPDSIEEIIFKWWNLTWWSIPYQRAYGRQMRFLLWDKGHNAPFGLIGMQSPVLKMSVRDDYLQIPKEELDIWVNKSLQAQRIGALPPYNQLIGGKMVALAMTSNELRDAYQLKYKERKTILKDRIIEPDLLFITTTSAFGKSSIYNRLKYNNEVVGESLGYTQGYGSFQIPEKLYKEICKFLERRGIETSTTFGYGPSRKIKLLYTACRLMKLPDFSSHNLKREFFLFPLVENIKEAIQGQTPIYYQRDLNKMVEFWKKRWCMPRSASNNEWKKFNSKKFIESICNEHKLK